MNPGIRISIFALLGGLACAAPASGAFLPDSPPEIGGEAGPDSRPADSGLTAHVLPWAYFRSLAGEENVLVIDVREEFLVGEVPPGLETARPIPLGIFLKNFVARHANRDRTLLIFDQAGHDLAALRRALEENGYEDYWFLAGGVEAVPTHPRPGS